MAFVWGGDDPLTIGVSPPPPPRGAARRHGLPVSRPRLAPGSLSSIDRSIFSCAALTQFLVNSTLSPYPSMEGNFPLMQMPSDSG